MKNKWNVVLLFIGMILSASSLSGLGSVTAMGEALRLSLEEERALCVTNILPVSFEELAACKELLQEMAYDLFGQDDQKRLDALKDFAFWWLRGGALIARDQAERVVGVVLAAPCKVYTYKSRKLIIPCDSQLYDFSAECSASRGVLVHTLYVAKNQCNRGIEQLLMQGIEAEYPPDQYDYFYRR